MTTLTMASFALVRVALPLSLAAFAALRQNGLSLIYLLLLLCLPLVPAPSLHSMAGHTGRYLKAVVALSTINVLAQLAFQSVLLALPPYAHFLTNCEWLETLLRHIGLVRLDSVALEDAARLVAPDVAALLISIVVLTVCLRLRRPPSEEESRRVSQSQAEAKYRSMLNVLASIGKFLALGSLCVAGSLRPSVPGGIYFLAFLGGATAWACRCELRAGFAWLLRFCALLSAVHLLALFLYQTPYAQQLLAPDSLVTRLLGMTPLTVTTCESDPRHVSLVDAEWATFLNPLALIWLYFVLVFEIKLLGEPVNLMKGSHHSNYEAVSSPPLSPPAATTQATEVDGTGTVLQDSTGSRIWSPEDQENIALKPIGAGDDNHAAGCEEEDDDDEPSVFELLLDGVLGLLGLVIRSSYIATNIIMMAWSIAYHSWLTFVLLLWASLLWITPNQRRAMLRCSPVLALYAQMLLLAQYVYSLDLSAEELPEEVDWVNLRQIGLIKPASLPVKPLIVKSLFTVMFWVTLRQFMQERWEAKHSSALVEGVAEPFNITVSTTAGGLTSELSTGAANEAPQATGSTVLARLGAWLQSLLTKFWIWVVAIMLFVIGLGSGQVVLYRIVYMALFLVFVLTFQLSYRVWRVMMYGFWLTVIVYSMLVLVLIYTYQFDNFPDYWHNYTGIPLQLQHDIGLEVYDTGALFVRLLTPTFFVVITVIQLHYFHRDFLAISDIRYKVLSEADPESALTSLAVSLPTTEPHKKPDKLEIVQVQEHPITPKDLSYEAIRKMSTAHLARLAHHTRSFAVQLEELCWRLLELHMAKIALLSVMLMAVHDVCAAHAILVVLAVAALPMRSAVLQRIMLHVCSGLVCLLILAQMTYQIEFIDHNYWNVNCTDLQSLNSSNPLVGNKTLTMNDAEWLGLKKSSDLPDLLRGYIGLVLVLTFQAVVRTRQQYQRRSGNENQPPSSPTSRDTTSTSFVSIPLLFPGVTRALADDGLMPCAKFLLNFGFYKFGVEVCLMAIVVLIGTRLDIYSIVYAVWLAILFRRPRAKLTHIWRVLILFLAIFTPLQYLMCVGVPPGLCLDWPWYLDEGLRRLQVWLFFPDYVHPPECPKLICDFVVLLLVCRQQVVFRVERSSDASTFAGGSNAEVFDQLDDIQDNPVPDFITYTKSWLDTVKRGVLRHSYWVTLVVVLVTGVNRDNLFSLGYLVGAFFFLHHGNDLYLLPVRKILHWWNILLSYNVAVIGLKAVTQMLGCLFVRELQAHACWLVQLLSVACLSKFGNEAEKAGVVDPSECTVSHDQTGLVWDGVCFGFLLMQRRLFSSYYFARIVDEAKAQTILASRGAELIEQLRRKRVAVQREEEQRVLDKIRTKMERIKENQRRMQGDNFREPQSHQKAIRSGDYYMFEEFDDDLLDLGLEPPRATLEEVDDDSDPGGKITVSKLLSNAMKTNIEDAADNALVANLQEIPMADADTPKPIRRKKSSVSYLSGRSDLGQPSTSASQRSSFQSGRIPPLSEADEPTSPSSPPPPQPPGDEGPDGTQIEQDEDAPPKEDSWAKKMWIYMKFVWALVQSGVVSATKKLNKLSSDYRYVAKCLATETLQLKERGDYRNGQRVGQGMWRPLPVSLPDKREGPSSDRGVTIDPSSIRPEIVEPKRSLTTALLHAAWFAVLAHSELVCYCMVFLHQVKSASVLSLPLPIMVFLWGSLSVPRPSKFFWVTIIGYTEMVVIAKYLCQFEYLPWNQQAIPYNQPFWGPRITGVERKDMYALYDLMLLLVVFFHRFMLKSLGLWGDAEEGKQQEDVTTVMAAARSPVPSVRSREDDPSSDVSSSQQPGCGSAVSTRVRQTAAQLPAPLKQVSIKLTASIRGFFAQLLEPSSRVTADVYAFMFICDFFNFMVVIFGFASFGTQQGDGGVSAYLEENKVPVAFLVMLILQFALMVVDRALFLRKFILGKIMFQVGLVIGVHLWMFFLLPSLTERPFSGALPPQVWYLVKCLYLLLSAYQIRCGYPTRILGNFLCKKYNYLNMFLFKGFMAVPFLFELRTLMDWMWTKTSMTLGEWIKMEDIFAHIFQLKCQRRAEAAYPRPPGEEQRPLIKYVVGGCSLLVVIFIIWFPMVLFALGNTVGQPNLPYDVSVELTIGPYQPVFRTSAQNSSLKAFSEANWEALSSVYKRDRAAQTFLSNYDFADVASAKIDTFSMSVWTISEQAQKKMIGDVLSDDPLLVKFSWTISRHSDNPSTVGVVTETQTNFLDAKLDNGQRNPERLTLANMLDTSYDDPLPPLRLQNLLPKFIKVSNRGKATVVPQLMKNKNDMKSSVALENEMAAYRDLYLTLDRNKNGQEQWWAVHESCNDSDYKELYANIPLSDKSCSFLNIYSFNDKAFPATLSFFSGGGIIGLYTTLVLVASKFMRGFFSGVCFTIMFDDLPDVDRILQLCLDIYLVRESGELSLEEALAAKLIFLFRSPSTLIKWTRPREEEDASSDASSDVEQSTSQAVVPRNSHD